MSRAGFYIDIRTIYCFQDIFIVLKKPILYSIKIVTQKLNN